MKIKKGAQSLDEYLRDFKSICDNLAAIKKPVSDLDKVFQFSQGLGPRYENFSLAMLAKPTSISFIWTVYEWIEKEKEDNGKTETNKGGGDLIDSDRERSLSFIFNITDNIDVGSFPNFSKHIAINEEKNNENVDHCITLDEIHEVSSSTDQNITDTRPNHANTNSDDEFPSSMQDDQEISSPNNSDLRSSRPTRD
ncbi:unnamed protein product [Fraxinus pennsylvanica]|uniref:Uncharacterized protein n=1 Tax=Fraxinus pennsylvanica TaxID=56036 RepID=A0AAD2DNQ6_9LAMI|nr:unnamed protein product [Fraxinus pennsylvanica]